MIDKYAKFLSRKIKTNISSGFDFPGDRMNSNMFEFQKYVLEKALKAGRYAVFADCGLGKTLIQLEWANIVSKHCSKPVLILAPLAVSEQTIREGGKFGISVMRYDSSDYPIQISNYEQIKNINCSVFGGVVLDESSILKNYEGATKQLIIDAFACTPYKLACTATPSPNDPVEIGNHAEFLNVMSRNEMLSMYFVHDGGETSKWRLKGHAKTMFYKFVSKWAVMFTSPADIGFEMIGYKLPALSIIERKIKTEKRNNGRLFNDIAVSATNFNAELRFTKEQRMKEVVDIVNSKPDDNFIIWVKHNSEGDTLKKLLPGAIEVSGTDANEYKAKYLSEFGESKFRILITKTKVASFGMNYQNCHNQIFASLDFSFEGLYQAIRRSYRFGQKNEVCIYILTTDTMSNVLDALKHKQRSFEFMQKEMSDESNRDLLSHDKNDDHVVGVGIKHENKWYRVEHGDCVRLVKGLENDSVGLSVFSPPFADLYCYSDALEDMGNSKDYKEFMIQFSFLIEELFRVMMPGRNVCVHCMDLPIQKGKHGYIGLRDFSGMILKAFEDAGFIYASRVTIWKNPVTEMQRTKALGLLHKQVKKDSTMSRVGIPDYILIFRKDGERNNPVRNAGITVDTWQQYASPVWMDIDYSNTLQGYRHARDGSDEKHICPLQLDTIERLIHLYSNPGDTVFSPFMGIGSEVFSAVKMDRIGIGFELKKSYYDQAVKNLENLMLGKKQKKLF